METAAVHFQHLTGRFLCCFGLYAFVFLLYGCISSTPKHQLHKQAQEKQPLLLYQKTPCYGTCPAYDALIFTNGTVILKAWAHVPFTDSLEVQLTQRELVKLKRDVRHLPYNDLETAYLSPLTDQPSSVLTFYEAGREVKNIRHQEGGPQELQRFVKNMDALLLGLISRNVQEQR